VEVSLDALRPNPEQPRKSFDEDGLRELADSIERHGLIQPIVVLATGEDGYTIVAGERRFRAMRRLGRETVSALVLADGRTDELALIENVQREDLHPLDEAEAMQGLMDRYGYTQQKLGTVLGKARPTVTNALKLNELPDVVKQECRSVREASKSILLEIARRDDEAERLELWNRLKKGDLTVRTARQKKRWKRGPQVRGRFPRALRAGKTFCERIAELDEGLEETEVEELLALVREAEEALETSRQRILVPGPGFRSLI
jgi:ParB family chromosome partitioning protein